MYQPALRPDQIRSLYQLKLQQRRPMTVLVREAVDSYLRRLGNGKAEERSAGSDPTPEAGGDPLD